ncbi:MAG: hypothetical protein Q9160_001656 [Pyrenula sp. 1 TL-2023]
MSTSPEPELESRLAENDGSDTVPKHDPKDTPPTVPSKNSNNTQIPSQDQEPGSNGRSSHSEIHPATNDIKDNNPITRFPLDQDLAQEFSHGDPRQSGETNVSNEAAKDPRPPNGGAPAESDESPSPTLRTDPTENNAPANTEGETTKRPLLCSRRFLKNKKPNETEPKAGLSAEDVAEAKRRFHSQKGQDAAAAMARQATSASPVNGSPDPHLNLAEEDQAMDDDQASKKFQNFKKRYQRKLKNGTATELEQIEYAQEENREQERQNRINGKRSFEEVIAEAAAQEAKANEKDDESFFMSPREGSEEPGYAPAEEVIPPVKRTKTGKISKKDLHEGGSLGLNSHIEKSKKEPKKARKSSHQKTADGRVSKPEKEKKKRGPKKRRDPGPVMIELNNLLGNGNDMVAISRENEQLGTQPSFGPTRNRKQALRELIASLPEDQRDYTSSDRKALDQAAKSFNSSRTIQPDGGLWRMRNGPLLRPHQLLGTAWMCQREQSAQPPRGGLLCDDMGLGKTIQTIACMVDQRPPKTVKNRTTLIVVPASITKQWLEEIGRHTYKAFERVLVYRAGNRPMTLDAVKELEGCDIVITTYAEVAKSYPRCTPPAELTTDDVKDRWWRRYYEDHRGTLHRMFFYRIVLDEAQAIKTHNGLTSIACRALAGRSRWCLTGTPIQNALEEFYPYFSFLKVKNTGEQQTFVRNYCRKNSKLAMNRLRTVLGGIMLRRTHKDRFLNKPIITLPPLGEKTIPVEFSNVERAIYSIVKNRFIERINAWGGAIAKNHKNIFVLYLRLRQLVSHPLLIQTTLSRLMEAEDLERLWRLCTAEPQSKEKSNSHAILEGLRIQLEKARAKKRSEGTNLAGDLQNNEDHQEKLSGKGTSTNTHNPEEDPADREIGLGVRRLLEGYRRDGKWEEINNLSACKKCFEPADDPVLLHPCGHLYCANCLEDLLYETAQQEETQARCLECSSPYEHVERLIGFEEAGRSVTDNPDAEVEPSTMSTKAVEKEDTSWIHLLGSGVLYSAKMRGARNVILQWLQECPDVKIIVFVQFRPLVDILAKICHSMGWGYVKLTGDMSFEARDRSIADFGTKPDKQILLASLKVGGLGLNLTMASRVLLVDLWWNSCVERQAFCRIWRIGATQRCEVTRLVVKESIDTQMLKLQEAKDQIISQALLKTDGDKRLTTQDLLKLFGPLTRPDKSKDRSGSGDEGSISDDDKMEDPEDEFVLIEDEAKEGDAETELARVPDRERRERL